jgi:hypothetical protein
MSMWKRTIEEIALIGAGLGFMDRKGKGGKG